MLIAPGGSEAAVMPRTRIGWIKFGDVGNAHERKLSLKIKERIYQRRVMSAMLLECET